MGRTWTFGDVLGSKFGAFQVGCSDIFFPEIAHSCSTAASIPATGYGKVIRIFFQQSFTREGGHGAVVNRKWCFFIVWFSLFRSRHQVDTIFSSRPELLMSTYTPDGARARPRMVPKSCVFLKRETGKGIRRPRTGKYTTTNSSRKGTTAVTTAVYRIGSCRIKPCTQKNNRIPPAI